MAKKTFSIDIRRDVVCGVLLVHQQRTLSVERCGISVPDADLPDEAVREVLEQTGYNGEPCRLSLGAENFFYRNLSFPFSDKRKIDKVLAIELEEQVLVDMETVLVDALVAGSGKGESTVVAAMTDREVLRRQLDMLAALQVHPRIVTISGVQTALQLANNHEQDDFVLVDVGCDRATIFVVGAGKIGLIRSIAFDDGSGACFVMDRSSQQVAPRRPKQLESTLRRLSAEIKRTLLALEIDNHADSFFLTGPLAEVPGVQPRLQEQLKGDVLSADRAGIAAEIGPQCGLWRNDVMTSALALGARGEKKGKGFNFRKEEFATRDTLLRYRHLFPRVGIPVAVCLLAAMVYLYSDYQQRMKELGDLERRAETIFRETLPDSGRIVDPVQQLTVEVREMKRGMLGEATLQANLKVIDLLAEISAQVPVSINVHVVRMVADREGVLLRGLTETFKNVDNLKKVLEESEYFDKVTINSANLATRSSGIRFELKLELRRG